MVLKKENMKAQNQDTERGLESRQMLVAAIHMPPPPVHRG
jgi:hypothetical protein